MTDKNTKVALVTGASRGLGAAVAQALAAQGTHVIALARTVGGLEELDDRIQAAGGSATLVPLDITDESGLQRLCLSIFERWGKLDLLVHCAIHAVPLSPMAHVGEKDWVKSTAVNIHATQRIMALTDPLLRAAPNGIAVIPDDDPTVQKFSGPYSASKAAQRALSATWRAENVDLGIKVLTFTPNPMPTALRARFFPGEDRSVLAAPMVEAKRLLAQL